MPKSLSRRLTLMAAGLSAAGVATAAIRGNASEAASGDPLLLGKVNLAGNKRTLLRSRVGKDSAGSARATLEVENLNPAGEGVGLFVWGVGNACITTYGQLGATGIRANSNDGYAIEAQGRVSFDYSGAVRFKVGQSVRKVKLISGQLVVPETSFVLATLQGDGGAGVGVRYARRIPIAQMQPLEVIEIALTAPAQKAVEVAFWVFEAPTPPILESAGEGA